MKALVLREYGRLVIDEVPVPAIGPADVLVRVMACGICGSDVHGMDGSSGRRKPPIIMGHEAAGVVAKAGSDVRGWKEGDRVTFDSTIPCGACSFCRDGHPNLCEKLQVPGVSCDEYKRDGAFAEFVAVPARVLHRLPENLDFSRAALAEPVSIAAHAAGRIAAVAGNVAPGSAEGGAGGSGVVVGTGMVGLLVVQVLKRLGHRPVIAVDTDKGRLDLATKLGADAAFDPGACDVRAEVMLLTGGRGADAALEVVGIAPAVNTAIGVLRKGGILVLVGNLSPRVDVPLQRIVTRELVMAGSYMTCGEYPAALEMIASRAIDVDSLISARAPLADGPAWFKRMYDREPGLLKVVLLPQGAAA